jgi:MOB kinase activator 1
VNVDLKVEKDAAATSGGEESYSFWERNKTVKPVHNAPVKGDKQQKLHNTIKATMKATLGGGDLRKTVQLPEGEDLNEWIAVNTVHFYNAANMIYGTCAEFCTAASCPNMTAGRNEYLWKDGNQYKKATKVAAPVYIDLLLNWVNEQISNPKLFPVDEKASFPSNFIPKVKDIYKRLFRLYAHIYYSHFDKVCSIGAKAHLNTCFKHFVFFVLEFKLVEDKDLAPLKNFIDKFKDAKEG